MDQWKICLERSGTSTIAVVVYGHITNSNALDTRGKAQHRSEGRDIHGYIEDYNCVWIWDIWQHYQVCRGATSCLPVGILPGFDRFSQNNISEEGVDVSESGLKSSTKTISLHFHLVEKLTEVSMDSIPPKAQKSVP